MKLEELQRHWNAFGRQDPLWAILTWPQKRNRQWKLDEFFRTGDEEIEGALADVERLGLARPRGRALDFGCGVGRLTQALCRHFDEVWGVDIARSMIDLARQYNRHGDRCRYLHNTAADLRSFESGSFDFVITLRVLQHMRPEYSRKYIREFLRLLKAGAVAIFQIPAPAGPPAAGEPLAEEAFRASIETDSTQLQAVAGRALPLAVRVANRSPVAWPARSLAGSERPLRLGARWRSASGDLLQEDARVALAEDVQAGGTVSLALTVTAPATAGDLRLELDLVQEGVAWFADKGSAKAAVGVRVEAELLARRVARFLKGRTARSEPVMEMYATPQDDVVALVEGEGGRVVAMQSDLMPEGWSSVTYSVRKDPAGRTPIAS